MIATTDAVKSRYAMFKRRHPECLLMFRVDDAYRMFHEDAVAAHRTLGIAQQTEDGVPVAEIQKDDLDLSLKRLINAGHRVAICEKISGADPCKH